MESERARQSWATESLTTESRQSSASSLSRASSPWPSQLRLSSHASSELGDYASSSGSIPLSPTSVPLPPVSPSELAPPEPVHAIVHLKAELEEILECQRKLRSDTRYVQSRLHGVDYRFGPHLISAAPVRRFPGSSTVEKELEKDAVSLEERRRVLVCKIAEMMNYEINQIRRGNKDSGKSHMGSGEKLKETEQEANDARSGNGNEAKKSESDIGDDDSYADAVELQERQYIDDEEEEGAGEQGGHVGEEQDDEETDIAIQSDDEEE